MRGALHSSWALLAAAKLCIATVDDHLAFRSNTEWRYIILFKRKFDKPVAAFLLRDGVQSALKELPHLHFHLHPHMPLGVIRTQFRAGEIVVQRLFECGFLFEALRRAHDLKGTSRAPAVERSGYRPSRMHSPRCST